LKKILSVDFGRKYLGFAVGYIENQSVFLRDSIKVVSFMHSVCETIKICENEVVCEIIVGLPEKGGIRKDIFRFVEFLKKRLDFKIFVWNEDFSTQIAFSEFEDFGFSGYNCGKNIGIDSYCASLILKDYFENSQKH